MLPNKFYMVESYHNSISVQNLEQHRNNGKYALRNLFSFTSCKFEGGGEIKNSRERGIEICMRNDLRGKTWSGRRSSPSQ